MSSSLEDPESHRNRTLDSVWVRKWALQRVMASATSLVLQMVLQREMPMAWPLVWPWAWPLVAL